MYSKGAYDDPMAVQWVYHNSVSKSVICNNLVSANQKPPRTPGKYNNEIWKMFRERALPFIYGVSCTKKLWLLWLCLTRLICTSA